MGKWFTIVVCTYNGEIFLPRCLEAIKNLDDLHNLVDKVVVVDNNSTDNTKSIVQTFANADSIFNYEFEARQGLSFAREHAVNAETPWVIYVDNDNVLNKEWLKVLENIVQNNNQVGVVNGAVVAMPEEELSSEEELCLQVMYKNLACTHINEPNANDPQNFTPMGAGMCVRTKAIKKIFDEGWLNLKGRDGKKLSSGEDTELSNRIFSQGFTYICDYKMKLYHLIPTARLSENYTKKLIDGLIEGRISVLKNQQWGSVKCFLRSIKYTLVYIQSEMALKTYRDRNLRYWKAKINNICARCFLEKLWVK